MNDFKDAIDKTLDEFKRMKPAESVHQATGVEETTQESVETSGTLAVRTMRLPNDAQRLFNSIFGQYDIQRHELQQDFLEGEEVFRCDREIGNEKVSYYLPKDIVDKKMPSLEGMGIAFYLTVKMGLEQGTRKVSFTLTEKAERMGYTKEQIKEGGSLYGHLDRRERAVAGMTVYKKIKGNKAKGEKDIEIIGNPCTLTKKGSGKGAIYEQTISEVFTQGINFETGVIDTPHTTFPVQLMTDRTMPRCERNIRATLQMFIGLRSMHPVNGSTLLEWAKLSKRDMGRKAMREKTYEMIMKTFKDMGFQLIRTEGQDRHKDFRKWKFHFKAPEGKKAQQSEFTFMNSPEVQQWIDRVVIWQMDDVHYSKQKGRKLTEPEIREYYTNTVRAYGFKTVSELWERTQRTTDPSPTHFWNELKKLKEQRAVDNLLKGEKE